MAVEWTYDRPSKSATEQWARRYTAPGGWEINKEWFADGPSMFTWVLTRTDDAGNTVVWSEHRTLAAAKSAAEH